MKTRIHFLWKQGLGGASNTGWSGWKKIRICAQIWIDWFCPLIRPINVLFATSPKHCLCFFFQTFFPPNFPKITNFKKKKRYHPHPRPPPYREKKLMNQSIIDADFFQKIKQPPTPETDNCPTFVQIRPLLLEKNDFEIRGS